MTQPATRRLVTEASLGALAAEEAGTPGTPLATTLNNAQAALIQATTPLAGLSFPTPVPVVHTFDPAQESFATTDAWTWTAVHATALTFAVTAPPSGKITVRVDGGGQAVAANSGLQWCLFAGNPAGSTSTSPVPGTIQTVLANVAAGGQGHRRLSTQFVLTGLTPGSTYYYRLGHRCTTTGVIAHTNAGGGFGPLVITATPVSDRLTERTVTGTVAASDFLPMWLSADRTTFYGADATPGRNQPLAWSEDGETWQYTTSKWFASIQQIREAGDGEMLVYVGDLGPTSSNCSIWKSTGWATDKATASWRMVHEAEMSGQSWAAWSVDAYGPIHLAAEYGTKVSPSDMARYAYMSEDYGDTWRIIYDQADPDKSTGIGAHLHGIAYDPYWDAIWLCQGDGAGNEGTFLSLDRGKTWRNLHQPHQFTSIFAMPDRIIFVTDRGGPNGVFYVQRTHPDSIVWNIAWRYDENSQVTVLGSSMFQARSLPGAPLVIGITSGSIPGPGRVWVTYDGVTYREIWADFGHGAVNHGVRNVVGPSVTGRYLGWINRSGGLRNMLTIQT